MSYESHAEPIKLGILMDWVVPEDHPKERVDDFFLPFELVFGEGLEQGLIDRPIELVVRQSWGLPKGSVKSVVDGYAELVAEGCLAVFGPSISDNCIPMREAIEKRFQVPAISCSGSDEWLGEWTFALPQGSMTDEPILWAQILAKGGHTQVGALIEQSLVGESYIRNFRKACRDRGIQIEAEEWVAQTAGSVEVAVAKPAGGQSDSVGPLRIRFRSVLRQWRSRIDAVGPDSDHGGQRSRTPGSTKRMWNAMLGRIGVDQYDESNPVGQKFLDQFKASYGRRPEWVLTANRDFATVLLHAFGERPSAQSPRRQGGARTGEDGTGSSRISWNLSVLRQLDETRLDGGGLSRRAGKLDADGEHSHLVDRFGEE